MAGPAFPGRCIGRTAGSRPRHLDARRTACSDLAPRPGLDAADLRRRLARRPPIDLARRLFPWQLPGFARCAAEPHVRSPVRGRYAFMARPRLLFKVPSASRAPHHRIPATPRGPARHARLSDMRQRLPVMAEQEIDFKSWPGRNRRHFRPAALEARLRDPSITPSTPTPDSSESPDAAPTAAGQRRHGHLMPSTSAIRNLDNGIPHPRQNCIRD